MKNTDIIMREGNSCGSGYGSDSCEIDTTSLSAWRDSTEEIQYPSASRFWKTKQYLHRVRDGVRRCSLLEQRINLRLNDPDGSEYPDTNELDDEFLEAEQQVIDTKIKITDLISKLPDVNQQMVITERYVNMKTWDRIAQEMNTSVRIVQKIHGKALPLLEKLLEEESDSQ